MPGLFFCPCPGSEVVSEKVFAVPDSVWPEAVSSVVVSVAMSVIGWLLPGSCAHLRHLADHLLPVPQA